jgi:putative Mg2+ transporter-C (MgtC) family protein
MEEFWQGVVDDLPNAAQALDVLFRLGLAAFVGALPGLQREQLGMPAGLRTHMLVSLGAALFVMSASDALDSDAQSRIIQGLATGIGFLGAGAILKSKETNDVRGLTTAASVWLTAGLGTAVGTGQIWLPVAAALSAVVVLAALRPLERAMGDASKAPPNSADQRGPQ